jgi:hypothetical protein
VPRPRRLPTQALRLLLIFSALGLAAPARADEGPADLLTEYNVYEPYVTQGQSEVELRTAEFRDSSVVLNDTRGYVFSVAHSFTSWWQTEVYLGEYQTLPRNPNRLVANELENTFQLTDQGQYWADMGFLLSYEYATTQGETNSWEFGPLFEKQSGRFVQKLNLIWEREIGTNADRNYEFRANYALNWNWRGTAAPGVFVFLRPSMNIYQAGPALSGECHIGGSELEYSAAWVFGLNRDAPDRTLIFNVEYEFF